MRRVCATIVLFAAGSVPVLAQRLDACVNYAAPGVHETITAPSREARDRGLQDAGYLLTKDSLAKALSDQRPDVRSVAARKLGEIGGRAELTLIMQAVLAERDQCTKARMYTTLTLLTDILAFDAKQHPDGQWRVTPFQACTPSEHKIVSLTIEQTTAPHFSGPAARISVRNLSSETRAFVYAPYPTALFSATVISPTGEPAKIAKGQEWMYEPVKPNSRPQIFTNTIRYMFLLLPPNEEDSWIWKIGDDFDMSVPGTYRVSLGGRIGYLDTTVCSNTLWMTVE